MRLEEDLRVVGGVAVRDGDLELPRMNARGREELEQGRELDAGEGVDLGVASDLAAGGPDVTHGVKGPPPATWHAA